MRFAVGNESRRPALGEALRSRSSTHNFRAAKFACEHAGGYDRAPALCEAGEPVVAYPACRRVGPTAKSKTTTTASAAAPYPTASRTPSSSATVAVPIAPRLGTPMIVTV